MPPGRWRLEWLVKAGEGGTWQSAWDPHRLALTGREKLRSLRSQAAQMDPPLSVVPYVVVRGRHEWNAAEWEQIALCADVAGRVVLNIEPGPGYWNGPTDPDGLKHEYLEPMWEAVRRANPRAELELCAIPRKWCVDALGGPETLRMWLSYCHRASWECYDGIAPDLNVALSMARVDAWLETDGRPAGWRYRIPVVQRSRVQAWAQTGYARHGLEVWHLDGD